MLFFSGKSQLVFVLRRKKTANFILVLKEPSLFEVLPLTQSNHKKLRFRSVFSATNMESFRSMSENSGNKKNFFKKLVFPQNVTMVAYNATWKTGQKIFGKRAQNLLPKVRNWQVFLGVFRDKNPSKCSSGHLECSLHNAAGKRSSKIRKISMRIQDVRKVFVIFGVNHLKNFPELKKCSFKKPAVNFPPEVERNVTQKAKMIKKLKQNLKTFT